MIKKEKIIIEEEKFIYHRFCDDCGTEIKTSTPKCALCEKDLCEKCIAYENYQIGDYRDDVFCKDCWTIGEPFRNKIKKLEDKIDQLSVDWENLCKSKASKLK